MIVNRVSRLMGDRREGVTDLSRAAGIAYGTAYALYKGKTKQITFDVLERLCKHFGVTVCDVLEYVPDEPPPGQAEAPAATGKK